MTKTFESRQTHTRHTLHDHVKLVLEDYFCQMEDNEPAKMYAMVISEVEKALLESVLSYAHYNQSKAAKYLGLNRATLRKKLDEYAINTRPAQS